MSVGIEALSVYAGVLRIPVPDIFAGRGLDPARLGNIGMRDRSVGLPCEDPVTNAVNAARPIVDALSREERDRIEVLITSTESGIDYSKSVASYVHDHLGLPATCRLLEVKQACYAATGALQLAAGYVASGMSPGGKVLIVATDVALVDARAEYAEPAMGHGAAALLVSDVPRVLHLDLGAFGTHSYETLDSARPGPTYDIADADRSLFTYLDCLSNCFREYAARVADADIATTFDYLAMHTPFAGMVRAAHRKLMREFASGVTDVAADFARRVAPSLEYPSTVGNLCSGSVYLALASLVDNADVADGARVGLYSYGSGCSAELFSGVVDEGSRRTLAGMRIREHLDSRGVLSFAEYDRLIGEARDVLVPQPDRQVALERYLAYLARYREPRDLLVFTGTKGHHRTYEWVTAGPR